MKLDPELREVFLAEVAGYLAVLEDPEASLSEQADAAHGLKGAAGMLGFSALHSRAAELEAALRRADDRMRQDHVRRIRDQVAALTQETDRAESRGPVGAAPADDGAPPQARAEAPPLGSEDSGGAAQGDLADGAAGTAEEAFDESFDPETAELLRAYFLEEASEHLATMDEALEGLRSDALRAESLAVLFRASHTLKGAAATVGLHEPSRAAHRLEDLFEVMRDRAVALSAETVTRLQEAIDLLRGAVEAETGERARAFREQVEALAAALAESMSRQTGPGGAAAAKAPSTACEGSPVTGSGAGEADALPEEWDEETRALLRATFVEEAEELLGRLDPAVETLWRGEHESVDLDELFRLAHTLKGSAAAVGLHRLSAAAHRLEDAFDGLRGGAAAAGEADWLGALAALHDLVAHLDDEAVTEEAAARLARALGSPPPELAGSGSTPAPGIAGESGPGRPGPGPTPASAPAAPERVDGRAVADGPAVRPEVERRRGGDRRQAGRREEDPQLIRVHVERFDALLEAVGQIVFRRTLIERRSLEVTDLVRDVARSHQGLRAAIADLRSLRGAERHVQRLGELEVEFADEVSNLERAEAGLREETEGLRRDAAALQAGLTAMRLLSVRYLFARLRRAVRDAARTEGKQVIVETAGEETEIDRVVAEKVADPLIQIIRNAVAHGIEAPEVRQAAGKPPAGRVTLTASQEGSFVTLEVTDDGAGIDVGSVRQALVARGFMAPEEAERASEAALRAAIFMPGLSTRQSADAVAGRGVGLDVVRDTITRLGGEVTVNSEPGRYTRFRVRLPLSTAVTNALLFKTGGEVYCIPIRHVVETRYLKPDEIGERQGRPVVRARDQVLPVLFLDAALQVESRRQGALLPAVVLRHLDMEFVVVVDKLIGPREIVLRHLGPLLSPLDLYAGATISGAGKVQMVLDVGVLHQWASAWRRRAALPSAQGRGPRDALAGTAPARILVCDDSRSIRQVLDRMLAEEGFRVELAADGWDAWERLCAVGADLLLTDLEMPRMDGYALVEKCRKDARFAPLPILVLSSRTGLENQRRAQEAGANGFLFKPVNRRVIVARIREMLASGAAAGAGG